MRIAGLDMLRGFAISLVLLRHAWPDAFGSAGIVGVVTFFALSGYLITGILLRDIDRRGGVNYRRFYRNRAIRLLPALFLFLAGFALVTLVWDPLGQRSTLWQTMLVGATYTANLPVPQGSTAISHLWTLATEEQFYLVWPLVLTFAVRRKQLRGVVLASATLMVLALLATLYVRRGEIERIYDLPTSWALAMLIGAAAQIWRHRISVILPADARSRGRVGAGLVITLIALALIPDIKDSPLAYLLLGPAVAITSTALAFIWSDWRDSPTRALIPLLHLGTISYAAYLWNYPIVVWSRVVSDAVWMPPLTIIVTIAVAAASWWAVEQPAHRFRERLDGRRAAAPDVAPPALRPQH